MNQVKQPPKNLCTGLLVFLRCEENGSVQFCLFCQNKKKESKILGLVLVVLPKQIK